MPRLHQASFFKDRKQIDIFDGPVSTVHLVRAYV